MRFTYIPTTKTAIKALHDEARRLQRDGVGPYGNNLEKVATAAGYANWHHVKWCHKHRFDFCGPVQSSLTPIESHSIGHEGAQCFPGFIAFPVSAGEYGRQQITDAVMNGLTISPCSNFILFPEYDNEDEEPMCEDYSYRGE